MAEIVRTYEQVQSAKDSEKLVTLHIYSDGHTREIDPSTNKLVTRTNPTEQYGDAIHTAPRKEAIMSRVDTLLTAMGIDKDHDEYEIAVQLARTWVSSERSDAGIRSYRELMERFGGVADLQVWDEYTIKYNGEMYTKNGTYAKRIGLSSEDMGRIASKILDPHKRQAAIELAKEQGYDI